MDDLHCLSWLSLSGAFDTVNYIFLSLSGCCYPSFSHFPQHLVDFCRGFFHKLFLGLSILKVTNHKLKYHKWSWPISIREIVNKNNKHCRSQGACSQKSLILYFFADGSVPCRSMLSLWLCSPVCLPQSRRATPRTLLAKVVIPTLFCYAARLLWYTCLWEISI